MKIIVTGGTGFIGRACLAQCINDKRVSEVLVLSRRPIDEKLATQEKVKVVIHKDFSDYPLEIMDQLQGAEGCIWCLGGKVSDFGGNVQAARRVGVDFTLAGANAFIEHLASKLEPGSAFHFVFCSGRGAEQDAAKKLWIVRDTRLIKGEVERGLLELAERHNSFKVVVLRPGGVLAGDSMVTSLSKGLFIKSSDLAAALTEACIHMPRQEILENEDIRQAVTDRKLSDWVWAP